MRRAAAGIGLAPPILYADPASGVMLSRYIAGAVPLSPERLREEDHFRAAVGLLQRLHGSGLAFTGEMRLYPKLDQYLAMASTPALRELRRAGEVLRPVIEPGWGALRPCHIDPAPHNFIAAAGRHFLLDWEYAAMCDPVWDLAGLSIEGRFDPAQDAAMVVAIFRRDSAVGGLGQPSPSLPHHAAPGRRLLGGRADRHGQRQLDGGRAGRSAGGPYGRRSRRSRPRRPPRQGRLKAPTSALY